MCTATCIPSIPHSPPPKKIIISKNFSKTSPQKIKPTKKKSTCPWRWCCYNYCWPYLMLMANHLCKAVPYNWASHPRTAPCCLAVQQTPQREVAQAQMEYYLGVNPKIGGCFPQNEWLKKWKAPPNKVLFLKTPGFVFLMIFVVFCRLSMKRRDNCF